MGRSTELTDSRISLFSAQRGKCALSGELFENAADIVCWLKTPAELGGKERYRNMILFYNRFLPLLQECPKNELKEIADTLKATKELMLKSEQSAPAGWFVRNRKLTFHLVID